MKHILAMHFQQSHRCFIKSIFTELFWVALMLLMNDFIDWTTIHVVNDYVDLFAPLIEIDALDYFIAIKESN